MIDPETGFPTGYEPRPLDAPRSPFLAALDADRRLSVAERTRRVLAVSPYLWESMAFNLWRHEGHGPAGGQDACRAWNALPETERGAWIARAHAEQEAFLNQPTPPDDDGGEPAPMPAPDLRIA